MDPPPCSGTARASSLRSTRRTGRTVWRFRGGSRRDVSATRARGASTSARGTIGSTRSTRARAGSTGASPPATESRAAWRSLDRTIFVGSYDGRLYALDARSGRLRWAAGGGALGGLYATPSVANGRVIVGSTNGRVYAFATSTGKLLWSIRTGSYVYSPAALAGGTAYIGSYDHRLYALSQATGRIRWTFDADAPISGAPTVLGGLRLLLDLRIVLELRVEPSGAADIRPRYPHRSTRLAVSRRRVQPGDRRPRAAVPHGLTRPCTASFPQPDEGDGPRTEARLKWATGPLAGRLFIDLYLGAQQSACPSAPDRILSSFHQRISSSLRPRAAPPLAVH